MLDKKNVEKLITPFANGLVSGKKKYSTINSNIIKMNSYFNIKTNF